MGSANSINKIEEKERTRTHKLVSLIEARKQFAKLPVTDILTADGKLTRKFQSLPVLRNFLVDRYRDSKSGWSTLLLGSSEGIEVDGEYSQQWATLYQLLRNTVKTSPAVIPDNYYLGLDKEQYDALYALYPPTASSSTSSIVSTLSLVG